MADTQRTLSSILALLADNNTGDISAQDIRDTVVTLAPGHGKMYISSSTATTVSVLNTWYQTGGTWTLDSGAGNFSMDTNGRLQFDGDVARNVIVLVSVSMTTASNSQVTEWAVAKNGTPIAASTIQRKTGTGSDVGAAAVVSFTTVTTGNYLSLMCRNTTSASNITATKANFIAIAIPD